MSNDQNTLSSPNSVGRYQFISVSNSPLMYFLSDTATSVTWHYTGTVWKVAPFLGAAPWDPIPEPQNRGRI